MDKENIIKIAKNLGWKYANKSLIKTFEFNNFNEVQNWINNIVVDISEKQQHHPSMIWEYNKLTLVVFTQSEKDVTDKDRIFIEELEKEDSWRNKTANYL